MRVTLDTNVLVSSTFWEGASDKIIQRAENKEIELILSREILKEFAEVLQYREIQEKIKNKNLEMKRTLEKIMGIAIIVEPKQRINAVKEDPDDNKILECAKEGKAEFIITKDNHLLKLKQVESIKIITPEEFLKHHH